MRTVCRCSRGSIGSPRKAHASSVSSHIICMRSAAVPGTRSSSGGRVPRRNIRETRGQEMSLAPSATASIDPQAAPSADFRGRSPSFPRALGRKQRLAPALAHPEQSISPAVHAHAGAKMATDLAVHGTCCWRDVLMGWRWQGAVPSRSDRIRFRHETFDYTELALHGARVRVVVHVRGGVCTRRGRRSPCSRPKLRRRLPLRLGHGRRWPSG